VRLFLIADRSTERDGGLIAGEVSPGVNLNGRRNLSARVRLSAGNVRAGDRVFPQTQLLYTLQVSPSRVISRITVDGFAGQQVDFENVRAGTGASVSVGMLVRPTNSLELGIDEAVRWLNERVSGGAPSRAFTAGVSRLRGTYNFSSRMFLRLIGQYVSTTRDPLLYVAAVAAREGEFTGSALFAYKLNWQSVVFVGYGDDRTLVDTTPPRLARTGRQVFMKFSYALQR
jgi:hypothetical protein